uniref:Protein translocase subunit SecY n=1 Tax=Pseudo-nitzschia sp. TaxID=1804765 RepID=A0A8T9D1D0_9STRA|nr:SecY-type transporter protein [Pseudo-nitzschia simulans]UBA15818.1 SecY-type transporter protein [Pseudo-nitzschia sp.]
MGLRKIILQKILPRFLITSAILLFIRTGAAIPIPGIDHNDLAFAIQKNLVTKNLVRTFLGDQVLIVGLFTLNIFPAINASIIMQFLIGFSPQLSQLQKEGDFQGRREISRLTRNITLIIAVVQSIGLTLYLRPVLLNWSLFLGIQLVLWLTAGAMTVLWLSEIITDYGLGNGTSLLVYTNIVVNLPNFINKVLEDNAKQTMVMSFLSSTVLSILLATALYAIVLLQSSIFEVDLVSSKRLNRSSTRQYFGKASLSYLPIRFNQAGVMPIILTTTFLVIPNYIVNLGIFQSLNFLTNFKFVYWIGYFVLILGFSSFYTSLVLNPKDIADQLQKSAVKIPGVRPGVQTIFYLKKEIQRITFVGATLLAFITILPNFIESTLHITTLNGLSTTSVLILGGVVLDLKREISNIYYSEIYNDMY